MSKTISKKIVWSIFLVFVVGIYYFFTKSAMFTNMDSFDNYNHHDNDNDENEKAEFLLLKDSFPVKSSPDKLTKNRFSYISSSQSSKEGSYKQITNNLRNRSKPDNETPTFSEFQGAFYKPIKTKSNFQKTLPLAPINNARRVNYFLSH